METAVPFRAWRYSTAAGDLSSLVAPPYDVIGPDLYTELRARSPYNVVAIDLVGPERDHEAADPYVLAARRLASWKGSGILVRDQEYTVTFVEQSFRGPDGEPGVRHGFLALMRLYEFEEQVVFPHEWTLTGPKEDRFRLMQATGMCLSPVFLLYDLPGDEITTAWKVGPGSQSPTSEVVEDGGTVTKLWATSDPALLDLVSRALEDSRFVIADGHHRYETALDFRRSRRAATGHGEPESAPRSTPAGAPAYEYVLAYFANMADPGLAIYATHRLVKGLSPETLLRLPDLLAGPFSVERLEGPEPRAAVFDFLKRHPRMAFGLWGPDLPSPLGLHLADVAAAHQGAPGHIPAYQELDVTILQSLVFERALGITSEDLAAERYVAYVKDPAEAFARLEAREFQLGFFLNPTGMDQIKRVAFAGERMPQKATFFHPKLPTGLVFHDLTGTI